MNPVPEDLPGASLVRSGLEDLAAGRRTPHAWVVTCAAGRLRRAGLDVPDLGGPHEEPAEIALYRALCASEGPRAYGRYNALLRELDSFAAALEARVRRREGALDDGRP